MRCFSAHKSKRRYNGGDNAGKTDDPDNSISPRLSFKSRVRAIQNAQRFINSNPKLRSSHPGYGNRDDTPTNHASSSTSPISLRGARARSVTDYGYTAYDPQRSPPGFHPSPPIPMPLPSPQSQQISAYRLPHPNQHVNCVSSSPPWISPKMSDTSSHVFPLATASSPSSLTTSTSTTTPASGYVNHYHVGNSSTSPDNSRFRAGLQPLPLPKSAFAVPGLKCFSYEELNTVPSSNTYIDDDYGCYSGSVKMNGKSNRHQDVAIYQIPQQQGFQEMLLELSKVSQHNSPHVCKLIGFHCDDRNSEIMLVYEKLQRGSLSNLLYGPSTNTSTLDWPTRINIACGAAKGLASLHEAYPDKMLYRDFRASSIQVDTDFESRIAGYRFVNISESESFIGTANARVNAYTAPETKSRGEVTPKSNVWSYGIVLLELLSGKQNMDEGVAKSEKHNLVKWAKPFLMDEARLFLIMDPKLQGKFPSRGAKMIADLVLDCLHKDPRKRPNMKDVLDTVKCVQEMRYLTGFPSNKGSQSPIHTSSPLPTNPNRSPARVSSPLPSRRTTSPIHISSPLPFHSRPSVGHMSSINPSYTKSPNKFDLIESPQLRPLIIPSRRCSSTFAIDEIVHHQQDYQSAPLGRVPGF